MARSLFLQLLDQLLPPAGSKDAAAAAAATTAAGSNASTSEPSLGRGLLAASAAAFTAQAAAADARPTWQGQPAAATSTCETSSLSASEVHDWDIPVVFGSGSTGRWAVSMGVLHAMHGQHMVSHGVTASAASALLQGAPALLQAAAHAASLTDELL